jgi:hypothetical protein
VSSRPINIPIFIVEDIHGDLKGDRTALNLLTLIRS